MGNVTIYDIAKEAKVSPATVSRVLTGNAKVNPEKEKTIRGLIEKYNFRPNAFAKNLIGGYSRLIGLIVADIRNPFYAELCVACENAAKKSGYRVLLCNAYSDKSIEVDSLDLFASHRVEAVIQIGCSVDELREDPEYVRRINRLTMPFISTSKLNGADMYTFGIDHVACINIAFGYLRKLGHERIAMLGGWNSVRSTYEKRCQYIYLLGMNNIPLRGGYIQDCDYDFKGGYSSMEKLLSLGERPTAVIAVNDYSAVGAISALNASGLMCPDDISIVSHDNSFLAGLSTPGLTSLDYGYEKLGEGLISTAINTIAGAAAPREAYATPTLVERESARAAADVRGK